MSLPEFKSDATLDFQNRQIEAVALGERCPDSDRSCAYILSSPLGHIYTNACPRGLHCVKLYGDTSYDDINWDTKIDFVRGSTVMKSNPHVRKLKLWLQKYCQNPLNCDSNQLSYCGLDAEGYGEFNSRIWSTLRDVCPPGDLISFRELAEQAGFSRGASQVVGYAINKNPYILVIGDHRLVRASGEIWCADNSQRNKLRRHLIEYENSFTNRSLDDVLDEVRARNGSRSQSSRSNRVQ